MQPVFFFTATPPVLFLWKIHSIEGIFSATPMTTSNMAGVISRAFDKIKSWIGWLWTYLWLLWFMLVVFVVYILRGPLKLGENLTYGKIVCNL